MATQKKSSVTKALTVVLPKSLVSKAKSSSRPSDSTPKGSELRDPQVYNLLNNSVRNYRSATNITELMRHMARAEGSFATAVHNFVEVCFTDYIVRAWDSATHQFSPEGTIAAYSVMSQMDTLYDYTEGFSNKKSINSILEMQLREAALTGAVAGEMILNKERLPDSFQVVGAETLKMISNGKGGFFPQQTIAGQNDPVDLNIPTFWLDYVHPDPSMTTPRSMFEACLKMLIYFEEFMEEIRKVVRQSGHNRLKLVLNAEKVKATAPNSVKNDPVQLLAYYEAVKAAVTDQINQIEPEEALIMYDSIEADVVQSGMGSKQDYTPLLEVIIGQYSTAMKTPPSVLGLRLASGSQNTSSVEMLMFLKSAKALQRPVQTVMSRMLTLAVRLHGSDVYVDFEFAPLDLRPERELEAFKQTQQNRTLELLSVGFITDDEAAIRLGCFPRPPGSADLSGTMFMNKQTAQGGETGDPSDSNHGDTPAGRSQQADKKIPRKAGGKDQ